MTDLFKPGANWVHLKNNRRNIVIDHELVTGPGRAFSVRMIATNKRYRISIGSLTRDYRFVGYDPTLEENSEPVEDLYRELPNNGCG